MLSLFLSFFLLAARSKFSQTAVRLIQRNFYVNDGLASVETEAEAIELVSEARDLCSSGKLHLHKFISNKRRVISVITIPKIECAEGAADFDLALGEAKIDRALGIQWCIISDTFQFGVTVKQNPFTTRGILSTVASIFDPLGFVSPFILVGKRILQSMCCDKVGWDEPLPDDLRPHWEVWLQDLPDLAAMKMPRCYVPPSIKEVQQYELHNFSDASLIGCGVCSYLRAVSRTGEVHCSLVMGKARVAPTKVTTRLELAATVVATRIGSLLKKELDLDLD